MSCILWHKWGKWSEPEKVDMIRTYTEYGHVIREEEYFALKQTRICEKCGKVEVKYTELGG